MRSHASVQFGSLKTFKRETSNRKWPAIMQPVLVVVLPTVLLVTSASALPLTATYSPLTSHESTSSTSTLYQGLHNVWDINFDSAYNKAIDLNSELCNIMMLMTVQTMP